MISKTTSIKKIVRNENKHYHLTYTLLLEDDFHYGIEVTCRYENTTETERIWVGQRYWDALSVLRLFAKETVFPIALKETWENL
ncbi:MAG: hypothetical protein IKW04_06265 [Clostridia bacterium]|nr:hypothetical protein [Clostridia bacterium]